MSICFGEVAATVENTDNLGLIEQSKAKCTQVDQDKLYDTCQWVWMEKLAGTKYVCTIF